MLSSSFEPLIEDETVSPDSVLEAELAPVSETASTETAINSSAKRECGFTRVTPSCSVRLPGRTCYRSVSPLLKHRFVDRIGVPCNAGLGPGGARRVDGEAVGLRSDLQPCALLAGPGGGGAWL